MQLLWSRKVQKMMTYNTENDKCAIAETVAFLVQNIHDVADDSEKVLQKRR